MSKKIRRIRTGAPYPSGGPRDRAQGGTIIRGAAKGDRRYPRRAVSLSKRGLALKRAIESTEFRGRNRAGNQFRGSPAPLPVQLPRNRAGEFDRQKRDQATDFRRRASGLRGQLLTATSADLDAGRPWPLARRELLAAGFLRLGRSGQSAAASALPGLATAVAFGNGRRFTRPAIAA